MEENVNTIRVIFKHKIVMTRLAVKIASLVRTQTGLNAPNLAVEVRSKEMCIDMPNMKQVVVVVTSILFRIAILSHVLWIVSVLSMSHLVQPAVGMVYSKRHIESLNKLNMGVRAVPYQTEMLLKNNAIMDPALSIVILSIQVGQIVQEIAEEECRRDKL